MAFCVFSAALESRVQSFELAYRMQMDATDAFDIQREPEHIRKMYGDGVHGRQTLIARRLLERGVRYVQLWHGEGQPWDNHDDIEPNHRRLAGEIDQPIGALLKDLKQRGMLDDTLIVWGGEFGRTAYCQGKLAKDNYGRDHHPRCFTVWMAGGGVKAGITYGQTDDFGYNIVDADGNRISPRPNKEKWTPGTMHIHDLNATILHLLGIDHLKLTYRYQGRDHRLTDVHGHVLHDLIA